MVYLHLPWIFFCNNLNLSLVELLFPLCVLALIILTLGSILEENTIKVVSGKFINGGSFVAPRQKFTINPFLPVLGINADWVAIIPYTFLNSSDTEIRFDHERQWWGERSEGVVKTIQFAKALKLKILSKPHVWVSGQGYTGDFRLNNESERKACEASYEKYILSYAKIADDMEIDAFCLGLEFKDVIHEKPDYLKSLLKKVRLIFKGKITYAANWDNFQNINFWTLVYFIGINAHCLLS